MEIQVKEENTNINSCTKNKKKKEEEEEEEGEKRIVPVLLRGTFDIMSSQNGDYFTS